MEPHFQKPMRFPESTHRCFDRRCFNGRRAAHINTHMSIHIAIILIAEMYVELSVCDLFLFAHCSVCVSYICGHFSMRIFLCAHYLNCVLFCVQNFLVAHFNVRAYFCVRIFIFYVQTFLFAHSSVCANFLCAQFSM